MPDHAESKANFDANHDYCLEGITISTLTDSLLVKHSAGLNSFSDGYTDIQPKAIAINQGTFTGASRLTYFPTVTVNQAENSTLVSCDCDDPKDKLCEHQVHVLSSLLRRRELRIFFDQALRYDAIRLVAKDYGLENEAQLDEFFELVYDAKTVSIQPKRKELMPLTQSDKDYLTASLLPKVPRLGPPVNELAPNLKRILVFTKHRYYDQFCLELFEAATARDGRIKNPLAALQPFDLLTKVENLTDVKFYSSVAKFQNHHRAKKEDTDLEGLRLVAANPVKLLVFYHSSSVSEISQLIRLSRLS